MSTPCEKCGKTWINGDCTTTVSRRARCQRVAAEGIPNYVEGGGE